MISRIRKTLEDRLWIESDNVTWLALIVAAALVIRVVWILSTLPMPNWDAAEYDGLAWRLASGEGYVNDEGRSTAFRPVGYPAFLSVIYFFFGHSWLAGYITNAILSTLTVILTFRLAREFLPSRVSLIASSVVALLPSHIAYTTYMSTESLYAVLVLLALIGTCHLVRHPNWKNAAALGFVIGLGLYVRPSLIMFPAVVAILILTTGSKRNIRTAVALSCLTLLTALITIARDS